MKEIDAFAFRAEYLAIFDEIGQTGWTVMIQKQGKPVAQLIPPVP